MPSKSLSVSSFSLDMYYSYMWLIISSIIERTLSLHQHNYLFYHNFYHHHFFFIVFAFFTARNIAFNVTYHHAVPRPSAIFTRLNKRWRIRDNSDWLLVVLVLSSPFFKTLTSYSLLVYLYFPDPYTSPGYRGESQNLLPGSLHFQLVFYTHESAFGSLLRKIWSTDSTAQRRSILQHLKSNS